MGYIQGSLKSFVNVQFHCLVSKLKMTSKISTLPPAGKISADAHECIDFELILG